MGELASLLSPAQREALQQRTPSAKERVLQPATVARQQERRARDAWWARENRVEEIAQWGVFAWHAGQPLQQVRALYAQAVQAYGQLQQALDFQQPVEHLYSVTGRDVPKTEASLRLKFRRITRNRFGERYGVYLRKLSPSDYAGECALLCAMIAQDWPLADQLAAQLPFPLSTTKPGTMTLSLLRYTVLDRKKQVLQRSEGYSAHASGIDFAPRRCDFALAIVERNERALAKALQATIQAFRRKWKLDRYVTPAMLRRYGTPEKVKETAAQQLCGLRWAYSPWAVAMLCQAACVGMQLPSMPKSYSDFVPFDLCLPEGRRP